MNNVFYGLWIPRNVNPKEVIESGIWENNLSNKDRVSRQMAKFKIGDEVFLYQSIEDVKVKDTPFIHFLSSDYPYKDNTLTKVKCWAIGKIKKIYEKSLEIEWDKNYTPNEWYAYFRQDGVWEIELDDNNNQQQKKYQELYKIAFEGKKQDYEWWFKNGILNRKNKTKEENVENKFIQWLQNKVKTSAPISSYPNALRALIPKELNKRGETLYSNLFECQDIKYLQNLYERLSINGDLYSFNKKTQNGVSTASLKKYIEFLQSNISQKIHHNKIKDIILYGAPGVGKTHNINRLISLIEEGKSDIEIFESLKENKLSENIDISDIKDRVKFVTFHQSFGYEDFIEGFRPNEEGNIELVDGIFKNICHEAQKNLDNSLKDNSLDVDSLLNDFANFVQEQGGIEIDSNLKVEVIKNSNGEFKSFVTKGRVDSQSLTKSIISRDIEDFLDGKIESYKDIKPTYESKRSYHGNALYYYKLYQKIQDFVKDNRDYTISKEPRQNYYLIIDEINRGNISKIFGELITLIEEDKRDTLEVVLPYSKETLKVPSNLYIIGTMNSTDKSIALIDIALRRRFTFIKMDPNSELIEHQKAKLIFESLNEYISNTIGDDFKIGHSYFMKIQSDEELNFILEYKIKPLLEEYYYGNSSGLKGALDVIKLDYNEF